MLDPILQLHFRQSSVFSVGLSQSVSEDVSQSVFRMFGLAFLLLTRYKYENRAGICEKSLKIHKGGNALMVYI